MESHPCANQTRQIVSYILSIPAVSRDIPARREANVSTGDTFTASMLVQRCFGRARQLSRATRQEVGVRKLSSHAKYRRSAPFLGQRGNLFSGWKACRVQRKLCPWRLTLQRAHSPRAHRSALTSGHSVSWRPYSALSPRGLSLLPKDVLTCGGSQDWRGHRSRRRLWPYGSKRLEGRGSGFRDH